MQCAPSILPPSREAEGDTPPKSKPIDYGSFDTGGRLQCSGRFIRVTARLFPAFPAEVVSSCPCSTFSSLWGKMPQYPCSDVLSRVLRVDHLQLSDRHYFVLWRARCRSKVLRTLADEIRDEEKNDDENHAVNTFELQNLG